jgi:hypothetical protein
LGIILLARGHSEKKSDSGTDVKGVMYLQQQQQQRQAAGKPCASALTAAIANDGSSDPCYNCTAAAWCSAEDTI